MDNAQPQQSDLEQIDRDDVIEQALHNQNENAGDDGDNRRHMSDGDMHQIPPVFGCRE